jgi:hypothetical protein
MREWIAFAQRLKKRPAITAQQVCQKVVHPCDCAFVELLHLIVGDPGKPISGNLSVGRRHHDVSSVAGLRRRESPGVNVFQTAAEAGFDNLFCESLPDQIIRGEFLCAPKPFLFRNGVGVFTELATKLIPGLLSRLRYRWPCL